MTQHDMKRTCPKCHVVYPATLEFFYLLAGGQLSCCKVCCDEYLRDYAHTEAGRADAKKAISRHLKAVYRSMKHRCTRAKHKYHGIKVLFESLDEFTDYVINTMKVDPRDKEIHRIDPGGDYKPDNICFVSREEHTQLHKLIRWLGSQE